MRLTLKEATRAILCGDISKINWNPYGLGKAANRLLLLHFKLWGLAGFSDDFAWEMTAKAEAVIVFLRAQARRLAANQKNGRTA